MSRARASQKRGCIPKFVIKPPIKDSRPLFCSLTSDRPYRKAMSPFEAKEIITKGSGSDFDPKVVEAFLTAFRKAEMEVPEVIL